MSAEPAGHVDTEKEPVDAGLDPTDVIRSPESGSGERIAPPDPLGLLSTRALDAPWYTAEGAIRILSERVLDLEARIDSIEDHLAASATDLVQRIMAAKEEA